MHYACKTRTSKNGRAFWARGNFQLETDTWSQLRNYLNLVSYERAELRASFPKMTLKNFNDKGMKMRKEGFKLTYIRDAWLSRTVIWVENSFGYPESDGEVIFSLAPWDQLSRRLWKYPLTHFLPQRIGEAWLPYSYIQRAYANSPLMYMHFARGDACGKGAKTKMWLLEAFFSGRVLLLMHVSMCAIRSKHWCALFDKSHGGTWFHNKSYLCLQWREGASH